MHPLLQHQVVPEWCGMREILRTGEQAMFPWPQDMYLQGGKRGLVVGRKGSYRTAFVEAFPPGTFLRGEGETVAEAEAACWAKYEKHIACDGSGEHGPYEPRQYENGGGFCVKCGAWFSKVCEPSMEYRIGEMACDRVQARWGKDVVLLHDKWGPLVEDEKASIRAELLGVSPPPAKAELPTEEELQEASAPLDLSYLADVLTAMKNTDAGPTAEGAERSDPEGEKGHA